MLIVKLGGSVIQENISEINPLVYKAIDKLVTLDDKIIIAIGGGKVCRLYQNPLKDRVGVDVDSIHKVGIRALNLQAEFIKSLFPHNDTYPSLIDSDQTLSDALSSRDKYKYFTRGAWTPGKSSDYEATDIAKAFGGKDVLRISDVDYVYSADPDKDPNAKKLEKVSWDEYLEIIGNPETHEPGASYPVDPIAARFAKEHDIKFYFTSLESFLSLDKLDFQNFNGSVIG